MSVRCCAVMANICCVGLAVSNAAGQWVSSITKPVFGVNPPEVYLNNEDGTNQFLLDPEALGLPATAPGFTGLAADEANRRLFASQTNGTRSDLYTIDYDTLTPTLLTSTTRPGSSDGLVFDGLGYDTNRGTLYGTRVLGSTATGIEGLYSIDPTTGATSLLLEYEPVGASAFAIGGVDYDPVTDKLYLVDDDSTGGRWIYSVDPLNPAAGLAPVFELPSNITDVDGVGAGDGKVFLMTDGTNSNDALHHIYDINLGQIVETIPTPYPAYGGDPITVNPTGGGAYAPTIPEPGSAGLIALALLGLIRRR